MMRCFSLGIPIPVSDTSNATTDAALLSTGCSSLQPVATVETVSRTEEFAPALERALAAGRPALLHLLVDRQAITMNATIDDLRRQATAAPPPR